MDRALGARPVDLFFKTAVSIVKSHHNSVRVLFDEIASVYFISKIYLYFLHWKWPAQGTSTLSVVSAVRHAFVPYYALSWIAVRR